MDIDSGDEGRDVIDDWDEKSEKKNDQDEVDGMRQEVYSESKEMHNERNDLWFKEEDEGGWDMVTSDKEQVSIPGERSNLEHSQVE